MEQSDLRKPYLLNGNEPDLPVPSQLVLLTQREPGLFNPKDASHRKKLLQWCHLQWMPTFKKSIDQGNSIYFHECCSCFTRRVFSKNAGHPSLQTCPISKIPSFRDVNSAEDLYQWLLRRLNDSIKLGHRCLFPALNREHVESFDQEVLNREQEIEMLRKRLEQMTQMESSLNKQLVSLKEENQKLLHSTKSWYSKYQEIVEFKDHALSSQFATPLKRQPNSNFDMFETSY